MKEPMELQAASVTPVSLNGSDLTATVKFRAATFAGDNYRIRTQIVSPLLIADRTWKSGRLTVWKKFKVQRTAMTLEAGRTTTPDGYRAYEPRFQIDSVVNAFREVFIEMEFLPVGTERADFKAFVRGGEDNAGKDDAPEKLFHRIWQPVSADLHLIGIYAAGIPGKADSAEVHATERIHAAIGYWRMPPNGTYAGRPFDFLQSTLAVAHELGHTLLGPAHSYKHPQHIDKEIMVGGQAGNPFTGNHHFVTSAYDLRSSGGTKGKPQTCP